MGATDKNLYLPEEVMVIEREVMAIERESSPPPYPTPTPQQDEPSEDFSYLMVSERACEMWFVGACLFTHSPISRVFRNLHQRQASTVRRNGTPGPECVIPLPTIPKHRAAWSRMWKGGGIAEEGWSHGWTTESRQQDYIL